jgi:hypothetical protein
VIGQFLHSQLRTTATGKVLLVTAMAGLLCGCGSSQPSVEQRADSISRRSNEIVQRGEQREKRLIKIARLRGEEGRGLVRAKRDLHEGDYAASERELAKVREYQALDGKELAQGRKEQK